MEKNQERLYKRWLQHNGLPSSFPTLDDNIDPQKVYNRINFGTDTDKVMRKISQQIARLAVLKPAGQGTSTLARQVIWSNKRMTPPAGLLIHFDEEAESHNLGETNDFEKQFSTKVLQAIVENFTPNYLASLNYGSSCFSSNLFLMLRVPDFNAYEDLYDSIVSANGIESLYQRFADGQLDVKNLTQLIDWVKTKADLSTITFIDIPNKMNEDDLFEVTGKLKWHSEQLNRMGEISSFASKIALFCTREQFQSINSVWSVAFDILEMKPYSQAELWQILSCHYQPYLEGYNHLHLTDIIHQDFMKLAAPADEILPLREIYSRLKNFIILALSEVENLQGLNQQLKCSESLTEIAKGNDHTSIVA